MLDVFFAYAMLGVFAGIMAGMLGIGGGVIIVPALIFIFDWQGFSPDVIVISAVATSLGTIIFTSVSAAWAQIKRGAVDWVIFRRWVLLVVVGSFFSGFIAQQMQPLVLKMAIALFLLLVSLIMLSKWVPNPSRQMPGAFGTSVLGLLSGVVSGLAGIGGGNIMVPLMVFFNVAMQRAAATASALGFPLATVGAFGYVVSGWGSQKLEWSLGYVYLPAMLTIATFTVLMAPIGVALAHRMPAPVLKRCFGAVLLIVSARMLITANM
ncbi:sulfite exporter TauE/SafE family protein [Aestuariirhabdus sp. LZHN29]|uniref:sulfite exporter TauE/SafE family protein n=1 Tax=Aestuariirhabdus sp. LZHN29 TaxID=3417462 RepID=UPI003CF550CC